MELYQLFDKDLVFCLHADSQEELFNQVANLLEERHIVTSSYKDALIEREKSFPTGLDMEFLGKDLPNVAIPHTDIFFIINNSNASQTNILAQLMDFFTADGNLESLSELDGADKLFHYISETINH